MATKFSKGQNVKVKTIVPAGPVEALRMDEDGNFFYQIRWTDENGVSQIRWFEESELVDG
jgi:uncharacterized protein YodC (DUF2158 family)